jgi:ABC-type multidrug transport system fused ATPase/permease subunit
MVIEPGKTTAIVGLSGAGKTTIINLLLKFFSVNSGKITFCGKNVEEIDTNDLRSNIGVVLQNNHIFPGSIMDNVSYGCGVLSDDVVREALKNSSMLDVVANLSKGLNHPAQELSGGQKQRLAIARIFAKDPKILFLDEPTASLDALAAEEIKKSIDQVKKDRTVVIISHDVSQFIDADKIYVMKDGAISQCGTHKELLSVDGVYKEIVSATMRSHKFELW